jgi:hypothetical protein
MTRTPLPRKPNRLDAIERARDLDEQMLGMIVGLASEVTVLRARLDACERLLVAGGALEEGAIDRFEPDESASATRELLRKQAMYKIFRPLREAALEAIQGADR